jgi:dsRNA-specific ribonuclease
MATTLETTPGIYIAERGIKFRTLIEGILKRGIRKQRYLDILLDEQSMDMYSAAFTSELVDEYHNYQVYEQLGDLAGNKFIVEYIYERFPQLNCTEGVKVAARLRINYGAKQSFFSIAQKLGFWEFISATNDLRMRKMKSLLEDVFEAFLGVTEKILNTRLGKRIGYPIVYKILANIFDEINISLRYQDLYDAKTRLKELFDLHGQSLGPLVYRERKEELITYSTVFRVRGGQYEVRPNGSINMKRIIGGTYTRIGEGSAALKSDAQQRAAADALANLNRQGWVKHPPAIYRRFAAGDEKKEVQNFSNITASNVDELCSTREKTKYQSKYVSTRLAEFCRTRNYEGVKVCVALRANSSIPDSHGMLPLDLLFIGRIEPVIVRKIMKKLIKGGCDLSIDQAVFQAYYVRYSDPFIRNAVEALTMRG